MFEQFCNNNHKDKNQDKGYRCEELSNEIFESNESDKYLSLYNDFINIRIDLIENNLKSLLINDLLVNNDYIIEFESYFEYYRKQCILLPVNGYFCNHFLESSVHKQKSKKLVDEF